jgi:subtilisin family serine protease
MRNNPSKLPVAVGLIISGVLLAASCFGGSEPAVAQFRGGGGGGFGAGNFGRGVGVGARTFRPPNAAGGRRVVVQPTGRHIGGTPCERFSHCGAGPAGPPVYGGGNGNGNGVNEGNDGNNGNNRNINAGGGLPAPGERGFVSDEVITEFSADTSPRTVSRIAQRLNLTQLESQSFPLIGATLYRWHINGSRSVVSTLNALGNQGAVASAQPNYMFSLQEDAASASSVTQGDPAQYVLSKLQIDQAHQIATGKDVPVAVIDSEIDVAHPDINGTAVKRFDAIGGDVKPQKHGTAMAGAVVSHGKLEGIAPDVVLLAARAFDDNSKGTSFAIYKSLQWAADGGARVINMSFAGPSDPTLHRLLAAASGKGIVLVAAAGNSGPKSAPLYPGADPDVIAVTATDNNDDLFDLANRGQYIAVAAPGVQILALAPSDSYTVATGTSIAAAHVSGVAALLLQHDPGLKPGDVRSILAATAKPLGVADHRADFGAGLVNAYRAVMSPEDKTISDHGGGEQAKR